MASSETSAAASRSTPLISPPLSNVPPSNQNKRQANASEVTPKGLHALCPYCPPSDNPKYFVRVDHFHAHIRVEHPTERIPNPEGYACPCHGRLFASRWEMERHTRGRLRVPCAFCGRPLGKASMQRHLLKCRHAASSLKRHPCTRCSRVFASALGTRSLAHQTRTKIHWSIGLSRHTNYAHPSQPKVNPE